MALTKGINSYVTLEEADGYFSGRLDVAAYQNASDEEKMNALITATNLLDAYEYVGRAISSTQPLAFPRIGTYYDPKYGQSVVFDDSIPKRIEQATCELGYHLLNNDGLLDNTGGLESIVIDIIELKNIKLPPKILPLILNLIKPLRINGGSKLWWRAN